MAEETLEQVFSGSLHDLTGVVAVVTGGCSVSIHTIGLERTAGTQNELVGYRDDDILHPLSEWRYRFVMLMLRIELSLVSIRNRSIHHRQA